MTHTKGNVIVENIQIGDIHYEFDYGIGIKSKVITQPVRDSSGYWTWKSERISNGKLINYGVSEGNSHYGPNLYDYEAYHGCQII